MGFRQGAFGNVWSVEDHGNYSTARFSISKKNQTTGVYETEFQDGYVRLVGKAHEKFKDRPVSEKGEFIKIASCDVTNFYSKPDGTVSYTPHFTIFDFEFFSDIRDGNGNSNGNAANATSGNRPKQDKDDFVNVPDDVDDEELPFN